MATSFQMHTDRENIGNPVLKSNMSKTVPGQRGLSTKTPRKALGDLGNIQHSTAKKFQTPKPSSKVPIFDTTQKPRTSKKSTKTPFSVLNTHKQAKLASDIKIKPKSENMLPDIEKMIPFIDQEDELPRPEYITKLLKQNRLLNPASFIPPTSRCDYDEDDLNIPSSCHEFTPLEAPLFDETIANIIGYDEKPQLVEVDSHFVLDFLPPLDDIDLSSYDD